MVEFDVEVGGGGEMSYFHNFSLFIILWYEGAGLCFDTVTKNSGEWKRYGGFSRFQLGMAFTRINIKMKLKFKKKVEKVWFKRVNIPPTLRGYFDKLERLILQRDAKCEIKLIDIKNLSVFRQFN